MIPRRNAGFTLLEVMIGLALLGLIVTLLFAGLRFAGRGSDAVEEASARANRMRIVQSLLRRELAAVYPYRWKKTADMRLAFAGRQDGLLFVSSTPPRAGQGGLHQVELLIDEAEKDGLRLLMRRRIPDPEQRDFDGLEDMDGVVLLDGLEVAAFQYYGADTPTGRPSWRDKWEDPQRLPRLVRLRLQPGGTAAWPDLVAALRVHEWTGCLSWDLVNERCWGSGS